ncbi:hypothetical protein DUNSADRAFT_16120 [Dunaliella salina]|uniref:Uncharacterized protein n=1 Tax=Dunaliella salina TaxID=3046 RepID=A0ABQ7H170_DUNSA|nr:hypothetical protein DUNSADRAFT_16120 [Dunaliella salina]|eukprot:KAF5840605.1 hypothetical protein DUNSADRAFT_16120 [Dunaliella salina]
MHTELCPNHFLSFLATFEQQAGPSTGAQGSSSAEQGLAIQQGLDSITQGNVVKDVLACVMELTQANPLFLQVVNTITQVMLAKPECRHIACFVVEACLRRPSCLPRAAECLIRQPECGLVLLYWELQVEEHAAKMAAPAAAEASAAQLASSQAEVEKLQEQGKAQAEALAAAEAAAQSAAAQLACSQAEVEKLKELSAAQAEALQAAAVAAGQLRQACQQEMDGMQRTRKEYEEQVEQLKAGASSSAAQALAAEQQKYAQLEREMARATAEQAEELSAAKHKCKHCRVNVIPSSLPQGAQQGGLQGLEPKHG